MSGRKLKPCLSSIWARSRADPGLTREVDPKKTRKALRRLARTRRVIEEKQGDKTDGENTLSEWEDEFITSVGDRLETFGSAFNDPDKGKLDEALSGLQAAKLREIEKKAAGKDRKPMSRGKGFKQPSFKSKGKTSGPRVRDINDDLDDAAEIPEAPRPSGPPKLRVIDGGNDDA